MKTFIALIGLFMTTSKAEMQENLPMWGYFGESCLSSFYGVRDPEFCTEQYKSNSECCIFKMYDEFDSVMIETHYCVTDEQRNVSGDILSNGTYRDFDWSLWHWECTPPTPPPEPEPEPIPEQDQSENEGTD